MEKQFLHNRKNFPDLLRVIENEEGILAHLVEKDYWIMHVLYALNQLGFTFELKGGTSLSKGYKIIHRFSEDIDMHIKPPERFKINENPKNTNSKNIVARKEFYDWLASEIRFDGIISVERDAVYDDTKYYRSGGIRLHYHSYTEPVQGIKEGILLEAGFDTVTPNSMLDISSWSWDRAAKGNTDDLLDNRAIAIRCYDPGYTFVEKLQTIVRKYHQERESGKKHLNLMRQYYDVYCLLAVPQVQEFIGTQEYIQHKADRFSAKEMEIPLHLNEAILLSDPKIRKDYRTRYHDTAALYFKGQPGFEEIISVIHAHIEKL